MTIKNRLLKLIFCVSASSVAACTAREAVSRDTTKVALLMKQTEDAVHLCYEKEKGLNPALKTGTVKIRMDQDRSGKLSRFRALQTFQGSEPILRCIEQLAGQWTLPAPETSGTVTLQWTFPLRSKKGLSDNEFKAEMQKYSPDFDDCLQSATIVSPAGQIRFDFMIPPNGKPTTPQMVSGFEKAGPLFLCISKKMASWKFPEREASTSASWTWTIKQR